MKTSTTEAIILKTSDFSESDRLIHVYARDGGRLSGLAKGARRSRKRFVNSLEPLSLVELTYREGRTLAWVDACKLVEPYLALRTDVERWGYAALVCEVILEMAPEGESQPDLFELLRETLQRLSYGRDALNVVLLFLLRFLDLMGYLPALEKCSVCRRSLEEATRWWWRLPEGAMFCPDHRPREGRERAYGIDLGTLLSIRQSRLLPMHRIWRLHFTQEKKKALFLAFVDTVRHHIRKDLKSLRLLRQIHLL